MIIYIHGFGGSGEGSKAKAFRDYFASIGEPYIAPSLSYVPELAIRTLEELIDAYPSEVSLIGSSLGGYYAAYLAQKRQVKRVALINPSVYPLKTLTRALGEAPNFYDNSYFAWNKTHLEMLQKYGSDIDTYQHKFLVLLQKGDELLDYCEAVEKYDGCNMIIEEGGNHSFDGIERHFETIRKFFAAGDHFKHTSTVKGVGLENRELARRVGDLYYDNLADFLEALAQKLATDADADRKRGRKKLAAALETSASHIAQSVAPMKRAWDICRVPTMRWLNQNGFNREPDFIETYAIPEDKRGFQSWDTLRHIYGHTRFLPHVKALSHTDAKSLQDRLERASWRVKAYDIRPHMRSKAIGDCDVYDRHYRLTRYVASKGDVHFYFDEEIATEDVSVWLHYGDDSKTFVEEVLFDENR